MHGFLARILLAIALFSASGVQAQDAGFAEPLQQQLANLRERGDHDAADAIGDFYALSGSAPVWSDPGRTESLAMALEELEYDGLDPEAYALSAVRAHAHTLTTEPAEQICADIAITHAYLRALAHLSRGRLQQALVEPLWRDKDTPPHPRLRSVARLASTGLDDVHGSFERARPPTPAYRALRDHYRALLAQAPKSPILLPTAPTLKPGDRHPAVALLRVRLAAFGHDADTAVDPAYFDPALERTVREFQYTHHLEPDGVVGRQTRAALNATLEQRRATVSANLERWRWLIHELRPRQLRVDIAAARIAYVRDGETIWTSRAQVGRETRPTPLLHSTITHVTFNPPWVVPPTILRKDKLPAIRANPEVLAQNNFRVLDATGRELDPQTIDWNAPGPITLRQDPGALSALGQVAIRFPNPFSVYLHDTPSQRLFTSWQRAFSSGCVRVERAVELAELLLADEDGVPARQHVAAVLSTLDTRNIRLSDPVPVLIAYWTADVDEAGALRFRPDIYGHDERISAALEHARTEPHMQLCRPDR